MVLGRILGTLIAVSLMALFPVNDPFGKIVVIVFFTTIGVGIGILGSMYFGPTINTDRPYPQDSLEYWIMTYGEEKGRQAYKYWLEELGK